MYYRSKVIAVNDVSIGVQYERVPLACWWAGTVHTSAPSTGKNHAWLQVNNYEFIFIVIDLDGPALSREHHSEPICIVIHMIHMTLQGTTLHCPKYVGEGEALDAVTWILEVLEVDSSIIVVWTCSSHLLMGMGRDRQGQAGTVHTLAPSTGKNQESCLAPSEQLQIYLHRNRSWCHRLEPRTPQWAHMHWYPHDPSGGPLHCPKYVGEGEALDAVTWILEVDSSIICPIDLLIISRHNTTRWCCSSGCFFTFWLACMPPKIIPSIAPTSWNSVPERVPMVVFSWVKWLHPGTCNAEVFI